MKAIAHNLALLLTPPGAAAIAVIRLSGAGVGDFLRAHFSRPATEGKPVHGSLTDGGGVIDDPVVVLSPGGTVADLNVHGGAWVVRSVLALARRAGFEVVETGPPPAPESAVDGETLLEREVMAYLPMARTELAVRALLAQPGAWASVGGDVGDRMVSGGAPRPGQGEWAAKADPTGCDPAHVLADQSLCHLLHPPRVAVVGVPNVGKSTLANQLFARERSITADLAGTTRDWVGEVADVDGLAVMLVDTPGLRETDDSIERAAIGRSREQVARADLVVVVLDPTQAWEPQATLLGDFPQSVRVVNKCDCEGFSNPSSVHGAIQMVATNGQGVDELRRAIRRHFLGEAFDPARPRWWTERQQGILGRAANDPSAPDAP